MEDKESIEPNIINGFDFVLSIFLVFFLDED